MRYNELLQRIRDYSNAGEDESLGALEIVVENVAIHLKDNTRREFAAHLPNELQGAAMMVATVNHIDEGIIEQLMDLDDVDENRAKQQIQAAWQAIKDMFDRSEVDDITAELPRQMVTALE